MKSNLRALCLTTILSGFALSPLPAFAEDLVIGLATAQTGGLAPYDQPSLKGLEMAVEEINAAGGAARQVPDQAGGQGHALGRCPDGTGGAGTG
ncbi:hypothetical protein [Ensifer canadensis]